MKKFLIGFSVFLVSAALACLGFLYFTKKGPFKIPGVLTLDSTLNESEISFINSILPEDLVLETDLEISASSSLTPPSSEFTFLYDIFVPVTDFYSVETSISSADALAIFTTPTDAVHFISVSDLTFRDKLLSIDDSYYLESFTSGAIYRYLEVKGEDSSQIFSYFDSNQKSFPDSSTVLTFTQTGVTALSRGMHDKLNQVGTGLYFASEELQKFLSSRDITHTSNESSFTDYAYNGNICSDWRFVDTLTSIGLDIVELTGNHNLDCGINAAIETIDKYSELNMSIVGGGKDADSAAVPLKISEKGTNITFLAFNYSTGGMTYGPTPGANSYDETRIATQIKEAKENGDFVIVDIQFNECNAYASEYEDPICDYADSSAPRDGYTQSDFFKHMIDLGADMVVGTSAHQAQTYELYGDGVIYYGLGNLFFDQCWWPGTSRSLVLDSYYYQGKKLQTRILGTVYDKSLRTTLMDKETLAWWLARLNSAR